MCGAVINMVYLLHFTRRYKHAGHYLGSAEDVPQRIERHKRGQGARLIEVITNAGIGFELVRTWPGGRQEERQLKRRHNGARLCPICHGVKGRHP